MLLSACDRVDHCLLNGSISLEVMKHINEIEGIGEVQIGRGQAGGKGLAASVRSRVARAAQRRVDEAAHRFLSNPVIEDYRIEMLD